ncbi:hypothetical protein TD95_002852 [Thielaviopsis punctulata]|uniref:SGF29 C-terminal domain-containing protein n=1 Tax=Thielaviopsis punctulata TaxID=72032 RepID=A0A0F4ZDX2_9PEZI|nr:hypothetical protein TD95_002852 [Thielaviopsis punctulata]
MQQNRSSRGSARNNSASHGEEVLLWEACKEKIHEGISLVNDDNLNLAKILALDAQAAKEVQKDSQPAYNTLAKMEDLCRAGVKAEETAAAHIKNLIEQLTILKGVQAAKEQATASEEKSLLLGPMSRSSSSRTRDREREQERERKREREREEKRDREDKRKREDKHKRDRDYRDRDRDWERDRDRVRDRKRDRDRDHDRGDRDRDSSTSVAAVASLYDIDRLGDSATPSSVSRRHDQAERNSQRNSIPPGEERAPGTPGSSSQPKPYIFSPGDSVAFRTKSNSNEESNWILGEVKAMTGMNEKTRRYTVLDVEPEDSSQVKKEYKSLGTKMILISSEAEAKSLPPWERGKKVLAMYPLTTTFYPAEVIGMSEDGRVDLRFDGENDSTTMQQVERRFVVEFRP